MSLALAEALGPDVIAICCLPPTSKVMGGAEKHRQSRLLRPHSSGRRRAPEPRYPMFHGLMGTGLGPIRARASS